MKYHGDVVVQLSEKLGLYRIANGKPRKHGLCRSDGGIERSGDIFITRLTRAAQDVITEYIQVPSYLPVLPYYFELKRVDPETEISFMMVHPCWENTGGTGWGIEDLCEQCGEKLATLLRNAGIKLGEIDF